MSKHECEEKPFWLVKGILNEVLFCEDFLHQHPMVCVGGSFFTKGGRVSDEDSIRKDIYEMLSPYVFCGLSRRVSGILETLRLEAYAPNLPVHEDRLHVANGTLFLSGEFTEQKDFAATGYRSNTTPMRHSLQHGCIFCRNFWRTKIS